MIEHDKKSRFFGTLFGHAIGDALGLGTEFMSRQDISRYYPNGLNDYSDIIQDAHRVRFAPAGWTDDTEQMLCIANAIIEDKGIVDPMTVARHFRAWLMDCPMGIGKHTLAVFGNDAFTSDPFAVSRKYWEWTRRRSAPNGAVMRTSVLGLLPDDSPELSRVRHDSENIARVSHFDPRCVGSSVIVSMVVHSLVYSARQMTRDEIRAVAADYGQEVVSCVDRSLCPDISQLELDAHPGIGYTLRTLSAALWCLFHAKSFKDGLTAVVMQGGDGDTNACVDCAILGAKFGMSGIPEHLVKGLNGADRINTLGKALWKVLHEEESGSTV